MCGIITLISKDTKKGFVFSEKEKEIIKQGFIVNRHRGTDSYGFYVLTKDNKIIFDKSLEIETLDFDKILGKNIKLIVAHHRKASIGSINIELAHPVIFENTLIIHNGTNRELFSEILNEYPIESDTQGIAYILNKVYNKLKQGIIKDKEVERMLKLIDNRTGVIFGLLSNEFLFFHKDKSRSLYRKSYNGNDEYIILASEPILNGKWVKLKEEIELILSIKKLDKFIDYIKSIEEKKEERRLIEKEIKDNILPWKKEIKREWITIKTDKPKFEKFEIIKCQRCGLPFVKKENETKTICKECETYYPTTPTPGYRGYYYDDYRAPTYDYYPYTYDYETETYDNTSYYKCEKVIKTLDDLKKFITKQDNKACFSIEFLKGVANRTIKEIEDRYPESYLDQAYEYIYKMNKDDNSKTLSDVIEKVNKVFNSKKDAILYTIATYLSEELLNKVGEISYKQLIKRLVELIKLVEIPNVSKKEVKKYLIKFFRYIVNDNNPTGSMNDDKKNNNKPQIKVVEKKGINNKLKSILKILIPSINVLSIDEIKNKLEKLIKKYEDFYLVRKGFTPIGIVEAVTENRKGFFLIDLSKEIKDAKLGFTDNEIDTAIGIWIIKKLLENLKETNDIDEAYRKLIEKYDIKSSDEVIKLYIERAKKFIDNIITVKVN